MKSFQTKMRCSEVHKQHSMTPPLHQEVLASMRRKMTTNEFKLAGRN